MITGKENRRDIFIFAGMKLQWKKSHRFIALDSGETNISGLFHLTQAFSFLECLMKKHQNECYP